jgi:radical SAM superfamily enzyme YgiQ (UPF0313 family)
MKVALLLTPSIFKRSPLIGLAYLSAYLRSRGHEVTALDLNAEVNWPFNDNEAKWQDKVFAQEFLSANNSSIGSFAERVLRTDARIIGFSVWRPTKYASLALAKEIKKRDKDRIVVFGGPEPSFSGEELIGYDTVDAIILGEGEQTLAELATSYKNSNGIGFCPGAILKKNGKIINCGLREEIGSLDGLPFPDYSDFDLKLYRNPHVLSIMFYRGCIRRCAFCNTSVIWKRFRSRSAESIFSEMKFQVNRYPQIHKFEVDDTALNLNLSELSKLCDLIIASGLKINWGGSALIRAEMDSRLIKKMAQAGCNCLGFGLESASQKVVNRMGKGFKIEDAERVIRDTHNAGIETVLGIIVGFPCETQEDFQETVDFIRRNRDFISKINSPGECYVCNDSYMHLHPEEFGIIPDPQGRGEYWRSKDGANTHEVRKGRKEVFDRFLDTLGVSSGNYATVYKKDKDAMGDIPHGRAG